MLVGAKQSGETLHIRALIGPESEIQKIAFGFVGADITELLKVPHKNVILSVDECPSEAMFSSIISRQEEKSEVVEEKKTYKCKLCGNKTDDFPLKAFKICNGCVGIELNRLINDNT